MRRLSHDLAGVTQRLARLGEDYQIAIDDAQQAWRDDKGRRFFQQHTSEIRPTISQLVVSLHEAAELFEEIAARTRDPDQA